MIRPDSFFGQFRKLFSHTVLKKQLEQMRKSGAYDGFSLEWKEVYNKNRLHRGNWRVRGGFAVWDVTELDSPKADRR